MNNHKRTVSKIGHYTIVEMMMVIAIFMIILSMAMAAWLSSGDQAKLRNAARLVNAQLNLARAKAINECKEVGVVFSAISSSAPEKYAMLICYDGDKTKPLPGENWISMPGGIVFSTGKTGNAVAPSTIKYRSDGSLDSSCDDFYLTPGNQDTGTVAADTNYYEVKVNLFTGRSTLTYHED